MSITLRVLDGADRGKTFDNLPIPVTIGREEGNTIQLNDERISRFHIKIQEDNSKFILTDLESTNGTKVNGDEIRLRILRYGDLVSLGRSLLLFGTENQIAERLAEIRGRDDRSDVLLADEGTKESHAAPLDFEIHWNSDPEMQATLHSLQQPELPEALSPCQAAQLSELVEYLHLRIGDLLATAKVVEESDGEQMLLEQRHWQNLVDLQARLSEYMRKITEPPELE
ncbi:MAG: FHA domain-containing protein [Pirellulales bacterium]|nr:FHA domain-containing protein [Pirellulales bacterium]